MDVCSPLVPNAQSAKTVQPSQGTLDNPTPSAKPFTRVHAVSRDTCGDASSARPSDVFVTGTLDRRATYLDACAHDWKDP
jgi:hypothetical protein